MGILLEIKAGPLAGKQFPIVTGQTVTFGRAEGRAEIALPHDTFMSGVHFAVECGPQGCRVQDRKSSNGTFLNGARIKEAMLANGDEIKGGQTIFSVKVVADAKLGAATPSPDAPAPPRVAHPVVEAKPASVKPESINVAAPRPPVTPFADRGVEARSAGPVATPGAPPVPAIPKPGDPAARRDGTKSPAFSVKDWSFSVIPEKWDIQQEFGLQRNAEGQFPSSILATEEFLSGITLQEFVESQISMLRRYLREPRIEPMMPPRVAGADECMAMDVRHSTKEGTELVYRRIYARSGSSVGVLTVTTLASEFTQVLQSLQPLIDGAAFQSTAKN